MSNAGYYTSSHKCRDKKPILGVGSKRRCQYSGTGELRWKSADWQSKDITAIGTLWNSTPQKRFKKFTCGHKQQSRELLKALGHGEFNCGHMQQSHELHKALGHGDPSECLLHSSLTPLSKVGLWVGMFNRQAMVDLQRGPILGAEPLGLPTSSKSTPGCPGPPSIPPP
eukprot:1155227-Pelagomonas_calceolata.AAC.1